MYLKALRLYQFRLFENACFYFSPHVNGILGKNAKGKTTLLEAIYFLSTGRSFRTSSIEDLIQEGKNELEVEAIFVKHGVDHTLKISWNKLKRRILYNRTESSNLGALFGILLSVPLIPEDIDLIKGRPEERRQYLNLLIAKTDPLYIRHSVRFEKAMRHRNVLLKEKKLSLIEGFEREMAKSSCYITQKRFQVIQELSKSLEAIYPRLGETEEQLGLKYETRFAPFFDNEEHHFKQFVKDRSRDLIYGSTSSGPHRDDFTLEINKKRARFFGSEGQKRCVAAALRLSEWERIKSIQMIDPILLIDDLGLGFDGERKSRFIKLLEEKIGQQTLLTATENQFMVNLGSEKALTINL